MPGKAALPEYKGPGTAYASQMCIRDRAKAAAAYVDGKMCCYEKILPAFVADGGNPESWMEAARPEKHGLFAAGRAPQQAKPPLRQVAGNGGFAGARPRPAAACQKKDFRQAEGGGIAVPPPNLALLKRSVPILPGDR